MPAIPRPFIAAGVAVVGTSAIAMSPVAVAPPEIRAAPAIQLAASTDWADIFARAGDNASTLFDTWREAPAPILQQIAANLRTYLMELPDVAGIAAQIQSNFQSALAAPLAADVGTLDTTHRTFYQLLPAIEQLPGIPDLLHLSISPTGKQLLALSTTALSGVLVGLAGPVLGPLVAVASSMASISSDLIGQNPDLASAVTTLVGIPAAMTDAFLNGGEHVDITALVKAVGPAIGVSFPDGVQVGVVLGGLLSQGGSAFNALDFAYDNDLLGVLHVHVPLATGTPVGPIGAVMEFPRAIARAIGWEAPASAAAARSSATSSLVAANEVPRSVVSSVAPTLGAPITARATTSRVVKVDKRTRADSRAGSGNVATKSPSVGAGSGKASSARPKPKVAAAG